MYDSKILKTNQTLTGGYRHLSKSTNRIPKSYSNAPRTKIESTEKFSKQSNKTNIQTTYSTDSNRFKTKKTRTTRIKSKTLQQNQATIHKSHATAEIQGSRTNYANRAIRSENMPINHRICRRLTTNNKIYANLIRGNTTTNQQDTKLNINETGSERNRKGNQKFDLQK